MDRVEFLKLRVAALEQSIHLPRRLGVDPKHERWLQPRVNLNARKSAYLVGFARAGAFMTKIILSKLEASVYIQERLNELHRIVPPTHP